MGIFEKSALRPLDKCEALGEDKNWYKVHLVQENSDGTFACDLQDFATRWGKVPVHNLRKLQKQAATDESFSEFDEMPAPSKKDEKVKAQCNERSKLSAQISSVLEDYKRIRRALSSIESDFGETSARAETENGRLKLTITCTQDKIPSRSLTVLLPETPTTSCANPFSWLFNISSKKKQVRESPQKQKVRESNLYHGSCATNSWNQEDLQLYQNEIQAEINRLRNESSVHCPPTHSTSSDHFINLSAESYASWENSNGKRPENVVWLSDGTMIKAEARVRGATYFLEDPFLDAEKSIPYAERLKLSNQWDVDSSLMRLAWSEGDRVEVWLQSGWVPSTIEKCIIENNKSKLVVCCNQTLDDSKHVVDRFCSQVRPWGYLEVDSEEEDSAST